MSQTKSLFNKNKIFMYSPIVLWTSLIMAYSKGISNNRLLGELLRYYEKNCCMFIKLKAFINAIFQSKF